MTELKLRYLDGPFQGREVLVRYERLRIGRSRDNDLVLVEEGAPRSSARHAEITWQDGIWWIADAGSRNGTYVNGAMVVRQPLRDGDRIGFGRREGSLVCLGPQPDLPRRATPGGHADPTVIIPGLGAAGKGSAGGGGGGPILAALALVGLSFALVAGRFQETAPADPAPPDLAPAASSVGRSTWLVAVEKDGHRRGVGSAFAVRADGWLATNAHVLRELERRAALRPGATEQAVAVPNETRERARAIVGGRSHPAARSETLGDDVALLELAPGDPLVPLALAGPRAIRRLARGTPLGSLGFPAALTDPQAPRAHLAEHALHGVRAGRYLALGPGVEPGLSGGPIFTASGSVVGVVIGYDGAVGEGRGWGITSDALGEIGVGFAVAN